MFTLLVFLILLIVVHDNNNNVFTFITLADIASSPNKMFVFDLWHKTLDHPYSNVVSLILKDDLKINPSITPKKTICIACQYGKLEQNVYLPFVSRVSQPLEQIHFDIWVFSPTTSSEGYKYYTHFINHLKLKCEAKSNFITFHALIENQFNRKIKCLHAY